MASCEHPPRAGPCHGIARLYTTKGSHCKSSDVSSMFLRDVCSGVSLLLFCFNLNNVYSVNNKHKGLVNRQRDTFPNIFHLK